MKHRLISFMTVASILLAGYVLHWISRQSPPRLASDAGEEIRIVACSLTSARNSSLRNTELVSNIINGLPKEVHVLLFVNDRKAFKHSMGDRHVAFVDMPPESDISIWPQDPFLVLHGKHEIQLVTPLAFGRENDDRMPVQLGSVLDLDVVQSDLLFEGGNIVCGEKVAFVGADTIAQNVQMHETSAKKVTAKFENLLGRPVIVVGESPQRVDHIDMVLTPLYGNKVCVADTRAGAAIANSALKQNPEQVLDFETDCEQSFFGRSDIYELFDRDGNRIERPRIVGKTIDAVRSSIDLADELDQLARQLVEAGYEVDRMPAVFHSQDLAAESLQREGSSLGTQDPQASGTMATAEGEEGRRASQEDRRNLTYPFLTYNNVLIENRENQSIVYLPQYGFAALDEIAAQSWRKLGFQVKQIQGFSTSAIYGGGMRCCTKVLLRN